MRLLHFLNEQEEKEELDLEKVRPDFIKKLNYEKQNELIIDEIITIFPWLLECDFKNAYFDLEKLSLTSLPYSLMVMYCEWNDGVFEQGIWRNGIWNNGTWKSGQWKTGDFKKGTWEMGKWSSGNFNGKWMNGVWYGGTFKGIWHKGKWFNGEFNGKWMDGEWMNGEWKGKLWKTGKIFSEKFETLVQSSKSPKEFYEIEPKCKDLKSLEKKVK